MLGQVAGPNGRPKGSWDIGPSERLNIFEVLSGPTIFYTNYRKANGEDHACYLRSNGAPGAIPTRDLPLRRRIHEPFVFNSYERA